MNNAFLFSRQKEKGTWKYYGPNAAALTCPMCGETIVAEEVSPIGEVIDVECTTDGCDFYEEEVTLDGFSDDQ